MQAKFGYPLVLLNPPKLFKIIFRCCFSFIHYLFPALLDLIHFNLVQNNVKCYKHLGRVLKHHPMRLTLLCTKSLWEESSNHFHACNHDGQ